MTEACRGWELEAGDHRVLGQLSRLTKAANGRISSGDPKRLARRLHMDESAWRASISELKHSGFVEEVDGLLYLDTRCLCEQVEGLPPVGAKFRETLQEGPVKSQGWRRLPPSRNESRSEPRSRDRAAGSIPTPYVVGGSRLRSQTEATTSNKRRSTDPGRKAFAQRRARPVHVISEPDAKPVTTINALRMEFKKKWIDREVPEKLGLEATWVLDNDKGAAFRQGLKSMRDAGITSERVLQMMDVFMTMVLSREIRVTGKPVWRVFLGKRQVLLDRINRDQRTGSAKGKLDEHAAARARSLDRLRALAVDHGSPDHDERGER